MARPASAAPQTESIPLATTGAAPPTRTGNLANGVTWSVDRGSWNPAGQGYVIFGGTSQTWTFDRSVALSFSVRGLTGDGECMLVPPGSVLVSVAPSHAYDPATRLVCYTANVSAADSFFTLGPTTSLVLVAVNAPTLGRGPGSISVTFDPNSVTTTTTAPTTTVPPTPTTVPPTTTTVPPTTTTIPTGSTTTSPIARGGTTTIVGDVGDTVSRQQTATELPATGMNPGHVVGLGLGLVALGAALAVRRAHNAVVTGPEARRRRG